VVGYDTLGHCFFLEDGNERDNVFVHNLGLVTRPGSLLPADRDATMCTELSAAARRFQHVPDTDAECMYVSKVDDRAIYFTFRFFFLIEQSYLGIYWTDFHDFFFTKWKVFA